LIDESVLEINIISRETIEHMTPAQRVRFILDEVQQGKVVILERGLSAPEELELVKHALSEIQHDDAFGVETPRLTLERSQKPGFFARVMGRVPPPRMMVIGPAYLFKSIRKDGKMINAQILTRHSIRPATAEEIQAIKPPRSVTEAARAREERDKGEVPAVAVAASGVEGEGGQVVAAEPGMPPAGAGEPAGVPNGEPAGELVEGTASEPAGEPAEGTAGEPAGEPAEGTTGEPTGEAAGEAGYEDHATEREVAEEQEELAAPDAGTGAAGFPDAGDIPPSSDAGPPVPVPAAPEDAGAGIPTEASGTEAAPAETSQDEFELDLEVLEAETELLEGPPAGPPPVSPPVREPVGHDGVAGAGGGVGSTTPTGDDDVEGGGGGGGSRRFSLKRIGGGEGD